MSEKVRCNLCGAECYLDELETYDQYEEGWYVETHINTDCVCGGQFENIVECDCCGEEFCESELVGGLCYECNKELEEKGE